MYDFKYHIIDTTGKCYIPLSISYIFTTKIYNQRSHQLEFVFLVVKFFRNVIIDHPVNKQQQDEPKSSRRKEEEGRSNGRT